MKYTSGSINIYAVVGSSINTIINSKQQASNYKNNINSLNAECI